MIKQPAPQKLFEMRSMSRLVPDVVPFPKWDTQYSAGLDLHAVIPCGTYEKPQDATIIINPNEWVKIKTGIAIFINNADIVGEIYVRSSVGCSGLRLLTGVSIIDCGFQGEIVLPVKNESEDPFIIKQGHRLFQMIFTQIIHPPFEIVKEFSEQTARGLGGFGSTGK